MSPVSAERPERLKFADRRAGQKAQQVDEVTGLSENASAADILVLRPMTWRDAAGVHGHDEGFRSGDALQQALDLDDVRGEAAVEADHQQRLLAPRAVGLADLLELILGEAERLFDEDVLAGLERCDNVFRMRIVARRNHDRGDARIVEDAREVRGGGSEAVLPRELGGAEARIRGRHL